MSRPDATSAGPSEAASPASAEGFVYDPSRERIYSHEILNLPVPGRQPYLAWINTWPEKVRAESGGARRNFGVWGTVGQAHRWAEALVMWEYASKTSFARLMRRDWSYMASDDPTRDHFTRFWKDAPAGVTDVTGMDRLMCSTPYSPSLEELVETIRAPAVYLHYTINTQPGEIHRHLRDLQEQFIPLTKRLGLDFIGAFRTLLVNDDEGVAIFACKSYGDWANFEDRRRTDPEMLAWRTKIDGEGVTFDGRMLVGSAADPLRTGKIL
jgi:hypothetical protein